MTPPLTESDVEAAALNWLAGVGWSVAHGPDIALTMVRSPRTASARCPRAPESQSPRLSLG